MDPFASGQLRIEPDAEPGLPPEFCNGTPAPPDRTDARRADVEAKQERIAVVLDAMGCEAALLLMPAHVSWVTSGLNVRGLVAESERPGIYTNGRQRWLLCSNVDTQRLFDEELDRLGFQLKEWAWDAGRAELLSNVVAGRKVAGDRPFPNMPLLLDKFRPQLRVLSAFEQEVYTDLGRLVAHAVEATARNCAAGQSEEDIAGQLGHRLLHHGAEPVSLSVMADGRGEKYRRAGFTSAMVTQTCTLQATAQRDGLFATAGRTVAFEPVAGDFRAAYDTALRLAAVYFSLSVPEQSISTARAAGQAMLANGPFEYESRLSQPGYGAGRFPAEELRRFGHDEPFMANQALMWQPRVGPAALVETVLVTPQGAEGVTGPQDWPFKRVRITGGTAFDIPDILIR